MSFIEGSSDGVLTGTTEKTIVAAPASLTRRVVRHISINNTDTAAVVLTLSFKDTASDRVIWSGTLQPGDVLIDDSTYVLNTINKSIIAVLAGPPALNEPNFVATWADVQ